MQKICKSCGKLLDMSNFTKSKILKDGYENKCKKCRQEERKKHILTCCICGNTFKSAKKNAKYCSSKCQGISRMRRVETTCDYCGKQIYVKQSDYSNRKHHYCDNECRSKHLSILLLGENNPNYSKVKYMCDGCGKTIYVEQCKIKNQRYIFCSKECYKKNYGKFVSGENNINYKREKYKCAICGKIFERIPSANRGNNIYCSNECNIKALQIKNRNDNTRTIVKCEICGKDIEIYKSKLKKQKHVYCSNECQNIGFSLFFSKENSPNWDDTKTDEERIKGRHYQEYNQWRKYIYERDNYTCQCCGDNKGGNLRAHHKKNYSSNKKLRTDINNGITLCKKCHKSFHDIYGYTNNNEEQLIEFISYFNSKAQ